jgi:hypothetical protein
MGYLAAYNTSSFSGSLDRGNINIAISSSIFSGSTGAIRFGDISFPPSGGMIIVSDSNTQLGIASASATPLFWTVNNLTDTASILNTINTLPERVNQTRFTTTSSAYLYLVSSSKYFPILGTEPLNTIVTNGLTMYLDAGQLVSYPTTASLWYDISGNNNSGSLLNGITFNNNALVFDGIDDNVNIESYISMSNPTTVCALINRSITSSGDQVFFGPYANGFDQWLSISNNVLSLRGTQAEDINNVQIYGTTFISSSRWYFTTGIINGPTSSIYLNGNLERSTTQSFNIAGWGGQARIGSRGTTQFPFPGQISNVQAYNKVLSQAEILQNYYQAPIVTNGLIFSVDAGNLVSYESSSVRAYSLSLSGSRTTPVSCSLTNGLAFYNNNGGYFDFDGTDDQLLIENTPAQSTGITLGFGTIPWMVNAWVRTSVSNPNNGIGTNPILSNRSGGPVYSNMGIGTGGVMKYAHYSGSWLVETGSIAVNNNQWHMLSWVNLNNNTMNLYVDGILDKNIPSGITNVPNPVDIIGASWSDYLSGDIAFLSISISSSLYTTQNIQQTFNAQRNRFNI